MLVSGSGGFGVGFGVGFGGLGDLVAGVIEAAFDVGDGGIPIEVTPAPTPSSFTEPPVVPSETPVPRETEPTPTEIPIPTPEPTLEPMTSFSPDPVITFRVTLLGSMFIGTIPVILWALISARSARNFRA